MYFKELLNYRVNIATVILFFTFVFGLSLNLIVSIITNEINLYQILISIFLYNCAFTIWHEAAHNNIFRKEFKYLNPVVGIVTSFFNLNPNFYTLKHDHILHHTDTLDEEKDRTFPRIKGSIIAVPIGIIKEMFTRKEYSQKNGLMNKDKKIIDKFTTFVLIISILLLIFFGYGWNFFFIMLLPRLIILPIHTLYVCYMPHVNLEKKSKKSTRNLAINKILKYLIFFHNYHGVHHLVPTIPWNKYEEYYLKYKNYFDNELAEKENFSELFKKQLLKNEFDKKNIHNRSYSE